MSEERDAAIEAMDAYAAAFAQPYVDGLEAANLMVTNLQSEVVRLTEELEKYEPIDEDGKTLYGVNFTADPQAEGIDESMYKGRAKVARIFLQGLGTTKFADIDRVKRARAAGIDTFVISWKDQDVNRVRNFLATIPEGLTVYACFNHEPENDHGDPGTDSYDAWSKQWKGHWAKQSPVIREAGFIPTQILMGWTLFPGSKRKLSDWTAPNGTVDVFGFDGYVNKFTPADMVSRMIAATKAAGLTKTMIAETGSQVDDPARNKKLQDLKDLVAKAPEQGVTFVANIYWNDQDPGFDCRMTETTADVWFATS